jgi:hypothetical protein
MFEREAMERRCALASSTRGSRRKARHHDLLDCEMFDANAGPLVRRDIGHYALDGCSRQSRCRSGAMPDRYSMCWDHDWNVAVTIKDGRSTNDTISAALVRQAYLGGKEKDHATQQSDCLRRDRRGRTDDCSSQRR